VRPSRLLLLLLLSTKEGRRCLSITGGPFVQVDFQPHVSFLHIVSHQSLARKLCTRITRKCVRQECIQPPTKKVEYYEREEADVELTRHLGLFFIILASVVLIGLVSCIPMSILTVHLPPQKSHLFA
jgi:hypothetical protein